MASWFLEGLCLSACNSPAICSCSTGGASPPQPRCEGVLAVRIEAGRFDDVDLAGLSWAMVARWPGSVFEGDGMIAVYIDERAMPQQRLALASILAGEEGSVPFEILNTVASDRTGPDYVPIHFDADPRLRRARLSVPGRVHLTIGPLVSRLTGAEQRVTVRVPGAETLREMEIARISMLRTSGPIAFEHRNTHAALGKVHFDNQELIS